MNGAYWFTADTHFGHRRMVQFRPFAQDPDQMTEELIARWNSVVAVDDHVYHLGDFAFVNAEKTLAILDRLQGKIHLVEGNHDRRMKAAVRARFASVAPYAEINVGAIPVAMFHYPMLTWNRAHYGAWSLHGHSHGHLSKAHKGRRMDVGVDCHPEYRPFSLAEVRAYMAAQHFVVVDQHGSSGEYAPRPEACDEIQSR